LRNGLAIRGVGIDFGDYYIGVVGEILGENFVDGGESFAVATPRLRGASQLVPIRYTTQPPSIHTQRGSYSVELNEHMLVPINHRIKRGVGKLHNGAWQLFLDLGLDLALLGNERLQRLEIPLGVIVYRRIRLSIKVL